MVEENKSKGGAYLQRRKVIFPWGRSLCGIYNLDGTPAHTIEPGKQYVVWLNNQHIPVSTKDDYDKSSVLYPINMHEDPRIRAAEAEARARGFDLEKGNYRNRAF